MVVSFDVGLTALDVVDCSIVGVGELADEKLLIKSLISKSFVSTGTSSRLWRNTVGSN